MSEENKEQPQPTRAAAGTRQTRGGARGKGQRGGTKQTRVGTAGSKPGVKAKGNKEAATKKEEGPGGAEGGPKETKAAETKVIIKKFAPVYIIKSDVVDMNCIICRRSLTEVCHECQQKRITDSSLCPSVTGKCGHRIHAHCIRDWLLNHNKCPNPGCDVRWQLA